MSTATKEIIDRDQDGLIYDGTKDERPVSKAAMMLALTRKRLEAFERDLERGDALQASMEKRIEDLRATRKSIDQAAQIAIKGSNLEGYELQVALRQEHEKLGLPAVEAEITQLSRSVREWSSKRSSIQMWSLSLQGKLKLAEIAAKPEFEDWLGDSVIRDHDGLPLDIYHGTVTGGFEEFSDVEGDRKTAIYGSTNLRIAAGYSGGYSDDVTPVFKSSIDDIDRDHLWRWYGNEEIGWEHGMRASAEKAAKASGVTSPIRTRYELTVDGFHSESPEVILERYNGTLENRKIGEQGVYPLFFKMENPLVVDGQGKFWDKLGHEYGNTTREVEVAAEKAGYDGVIFKNIRDNGYADSTTEAADVYAIFDPANIKSTHNVGSFERSRNIMKSMNVDIIDRDGDGMIYDGTKFERPKDDRGVIVSSGAIRTAANDPAYADRLRASVTDPQQRNVLDRKIAESVNLKDVKDFKVAQHPEVDEETPAYMIPFDQYIASETAKEIRRLQEATDKELSFWKEMKFKHENNELTEAEVKKIKGYTSFGSDPVERAEKINEQIEFVSNWKYINRIKLLKTGSANFEGEKYKEYRGIVQKAVEDGIDVPANVLQLFSGADWIPKTTSKDTQIQMSSHVANTDFSRIGRSIETLKKRYEEGVAKAEEVRKSVIQLAESYTSKADGMLSELKEIKNVAVKAFDRYQVSEVPETKNAAYADYQRLTNQYNEVQGQYQNISDVISRECRSVVKSEGPTASIQVAWDSAVPQNLREKWLPAVEWMNGLVSSNAIGDLVVQGRLLSGGDGRAYYDSGSIFISENNTPKTIVHEIGHAIEESGRFVDTSKAFIYVQSGNAAAKHLGGNFDPSEVYFEDKLVSDYAGKWYRDSTELISTGLEHLYRDPVSFAKNAPEHFNYTVAFVKGWIASAPSRNTSSLNKSGFDPLQPRDDDGRWVRRDAIAAAAQDVETADSLRMRVTDPEQRKRLDMAIEAIRDGGGVDFDAKLRAQKEIKAKIKQIIDESPDSEAEVILGEDVDRVLDRMDWTPQDLASIVGAPDDSSVHVELINGSLEIHVFHEDIESCVRFLHTRSGRGISGYRASDKLYMENDVLKVKGASGKEERTAPKGFGTSIFASQVGNCSRRGIAYITCLAGRNDDDGMVGYSVWPKLGYTASITDLKPALADKIRMNFPQAKTVLDVNSTPGGRQWWAENGSSFEGTFDLDDESPSMKTLAAYQIAKERVNNNG